MLLLPSLCYWRHLQKLCKPYTYTDRITGFGREWEEFGQESAFVYSTASTDACLLPRPSCRRLAPPINVDAEWFHDFLFRDRVYFIKHKQSSGIQRNTSKSIPWLRGCLRLRPEPLASRGAASAQLFFRPPECGFGDVGSYGTRVNVWSTRVSRAIRCRTSSMVRRIFFLVPPPTTAATHYTTTLHHRQTSDVKNYIYRWMIYH